MPLLSFRNLAQAFGAFDVFTGASGTIEPGARIGLVGANGIGKTTLLLILAGLEKPTAGSVALSEGVTIGYLRQEAVQAFHDASHTVWDEMLKPFEAIGALEATMRECEERMATETDPDAMAEVLETYGNAQAEFEALGGYDYDVRIKATLEGLGFGAESRALPLSQLSGGQKTRALLARLLLERPSLLILDEPTNHLDMRAVEWLEQTLRNWQGALLIVSHDRYFLDVVASQIWEMTRKGIEAYTGNYSAYLKQREERWERAEKLYTQEKERLLAELDYIKKNIDRDATNPQAVGRLRRLSRELVAIEELGLMAYKEAKSWLHTGVGGVRFFTVEEAEAALKRFRSPNVRPPRLALRLALPTRTGDVVLRTRSLAIGYPERPLFTMSDVVLMRGETAAVLGGNGAGKTTLLKTLLSEMEPIGGGVSLGSGVKIGYFAQAHDSLDLSNTVLDEVLRHKDIKVSEARKLLASYLFRDDDVFKLVGSLSGGERGKLALALLALRGANVLLLDEPSNHLDIPAQEMLQEVLEAFPGTILLVSHDRYLIDRLATQVWAIERGELVVFPGTYTEFTATQAARREQAKQSPARPLATMPAPAPAAPPASNGKAERARREQAAKLEAQIDSLERGQTELTTLIERATAAGKMDDVQKLGTEYAANQARLEALVESWTATAATT